jgi:TPR repeat protein
MKIHTYYDNLKIVRTAPIGVIKASYRALSQQHHPDKNNGSFESTHIMKIINKAYEVLSDPIQRAAYDEELRQKEAKVQQASSAQTKPPQSEPPAQEKPVKPPETPQSSQKGTGWVYILSNKTFPNLVKIGMTTKTPEERAKGLDNTGLPYRYVVEYKIRVNNHHKLEQAVHRDMKYYREDKGKEFFRCTVEDAIKSINKIISNDTLNQYITPKKPVSQAEEANQWFKLGYAAYSKQDYQTAFNYYQKAAAQGDANAQCNLGYMYDTNGCGVIKNESTAVEWYKKAAAQGHTVAQKNLLLIHEKNIKAQKEAEFQKAAAAQKEAEFQRAAAAQKEAEFQRAAAAQKVVNQAEQVKQDTMTKTKVYISSNHKENDISNNWWLIIGGVLFFLCLLSISNNKTSIVRNDNNIIENTVVTSSLNNQTITTDTTLDDTESDEVKKIRLAAAGNTINEQGDAKAQYTLGVMYENGQSVVKDQAIAAEWYQKAANQNHAQAQSALGVMYYLGRSVVKNETTAVEWYKKAADQGDARAQNNLGWMYANGKGVVKNETTAAEWYKKSAEQGYEKAKVNLALIQTTTQQQTVENESSNLVTLTIPKIIIEKNNAFTEFEKTKLAAEQGLVIAQYYLGRMYANGEGVVKNDAIAVEWYTKAAEQGDAKAQNSLAYMYAKGLGVIKNERTAVEWYQKAADQGNAGAQFNLGVMYANGRGVIKNERTAVEWYQKAAEQGFAQAQYNLGVMYANGQGVVKSERTAVEWWTKAAEQGVAQAQKNLGMAYANGLGGVIKNERTAVEWYTKAAAQSHTEAQNSLGYMYANGQGVVKSERTAYFWWLLASASGDEYAKKNIRVIENKINSEEKQAAQDAAANWRPKQ